MFGNKSARSRPLLTHNHHEDPSFDPASLHLAPNLLESFIPGYSIISKFILHSFGFDIGVIVSTGILLVTFATAIRFVWTRLKTFALDHFVTSVTITDNDDMFENCLAWTAKQRVGMTARTIKAVSKTVSNDDEDELEGDDEMFHTRRMAKVPPNYEPYFGSYYFWRGYRFFVFDRKRSPKQTNPWARKGEEEDIIFRTIGWSTEPLKELLRDIKDWSVQQENTYTVIRRPQPKDNRRGATWMKAMERPSRPMETVVLDPEEKARLIADVNNYLLPSARRWYARRGIPYRRGYLFHGPPGTGKSSLSFALAGVFGLEVYLISLRDQTMTESDLMAYFNGLPRRCIVLLEDIDTAGLEKRTMSTVSKVKAMKKARAAAATSVVPGPETLVEEAADTNNTGISLSGLLNAIDGVASHEGRVLVMTTNQPDKLDEALIRAGRVDYQVEFTLATKHQMREIFIRMYHDDEDGTIKSSGATKGKLTNGYMAQFDHGHPVPTKLALVNGHSRGTSIDTLQMSTLEHLKPLLTMPHVQYTRQELEHLADTFMKIVREDEFSPAEIQSFLIPRKKDPRQAVKEAQAWFSKLLKHKQATRRAVERTSIMEPSITKEKLVMHDSPMQSDSEEKRQ